MFEELGGKKYQIIYADPPWSYRDKCAAGKRGAGFKYATMSIYELQNMNVGPISDEDCALFMWVTMPQLNDGLTVIDRWGFKFKTAAFTWIKRNKKAESLFWGMGNWTRANAEICLFATRGKPTRESASVHSVIVAPIGRHSAKPPEVRDRIVQLLGDRPRVELFARETVDGWDSWGNEVNQ